VISQEDTTVYFNDIRFGQMAGWDNSDASFPFSYAMNKSSDNSMALNRGKFKVPLSEVFSSLVTRIKGK
jgi:inner membrane protein